MFRLNVIIDGQDWTNRRPAEDNINRNGVKKIPKIIEFLSNICLSGFAGWALYQSDFIACPYLSCSFLTMFCHGILGMLLNIPSQIIRNVFEKFRVLSTIVPIAMLNLHMVSSADLHAPHISTVISSTAVPFGLEIIFPTRNERVLDIVILSNVCSLGFNAWNCDFHLGIYTSIHQAIYYFLAKNATNWFRMKSKYREIPFNIGLIGIGILTMLIMKQTHI